MSACRSCGAPIEWATWAAGGKAVPLDRDPAPDGNLVLINGHVRHFMAEDERLARDRRKSHFATCPDAKDWRNR